MDISDIRRLYTIQSLLGTNKRWLVCPLPQHVHSNYTPSFSIFHGDDGVQRFKCHGTCGAYGDVIDLAGYLWVPGYSPQNSSHLNKAIEMLGVRADVTIPTSETQSSFLSHDAFKEYLPIGDEARSYAYERGLNDETIDHFSLGQDRRYLTMPAFRDGRLRGIKKRKCIDGPGLKYLNEAGSRGDLFNVDAVKYQSGSVFVVKAEIPAMLLHQWGFSAVAPTGGEGNWDDSWLSDLGLASLTVVGDNDDPGRKLGMERAKRFGALLEFPPDTFKDIDEFMLAKPQEARQWLTTLAT